MPLGSGAVYSTNSKPSVPSGLMVWEREEEVVVMMRSLRRCPVAAAMAKPMQIRAGGSGVNNLFH
ncbi:hypothetical protein D3C84_453360 [compost metagenome]